MRGEVKTSGGKLVGVDVDVDEAGRVRGCTLDGDFFIEGDEARVRELFDAIGRALAGGIGVAATLADFPDVRLVGTSAEAIETAFRRAVAASGAHATTHTASTEVNGARQVVGNGTSGVAESHRVAAVPSAGSQDRTRVLAQAQERRNRWHSLHPRVVVDRLRSPAEQVRLDVEWAQRVAAGSMPATLRFWSWSAPAVVVGRYQSIPDEVDEQAAQAEGFTVVRRCTGGGVMFAQPDDVITYSLYAPRGFVEGVDVADSYRLCDQWLIDALRAMGVDAGFGGLNDIVSPRGKIGGAAQRRFAPIGSGPGSVLHHDMLSYRIDAQTMGRVLRVSEEKMSDKAVKSAERWVDPLCSQTNLSRQEIVDRLVISARRAI